MRRPALLLFAAVPLVAVAVVLLLRVVAGDSRSSSALDAPRKPLLPDLVMPAPSDLVLVRDLGGTRRVFFTAAVGNVGPGSFELHATRRAVGEPWKLWQRFQETRGGLSERPVRGTLVWGGHGHEHWHVRLGASYRLIAVGEAAHEVRRLVKAGFCFFDHSRVARLPKAPPYPVFSSLACRGRGSISVDMGISAGWADPYTWTLPDQRIDVTGLADGVYRLEATADPDGWFAEGDERNNTGWVVVRLRTREDGLPMLDALRRSPPPR